MVTDPLADFLSSLYNASRAGKGEVIAPYSRFKRDVAQVLKEEGYVQDVEIIRKEEKPFLRVVLKPSAVITKVRRISKPGLRRYVGFREIPRVLGGMGICVLSTPKGVMAGHKAKRLRVGGELLLAIY
jgi:small subunit ribosomal protein S8